MPHIHSRYGQYDHAISAYIFRIDFIEPKIILHLHRKLRVYMQFGGHIELNENPYTALTREIFEESGYDSGQLSILQPGQRMTKLTNSIVHPQPVVYDTHWFGNKEHFHTAVSFGFVTDQKPKNALAEGESDDIRLFTRTEVADLPAEKIFENVREIALFMFDECLPKWERLSLNNFDN